MDLKGDKTGFDGPEHIDHAPSRSSEHSAPPKTDDAINHWTPDERAQEERKLVRKLDFRLMPMIIVIFIMNYIDRTAVTAARLRGLEADLNLSGQSPSYYNETIWALIRTPAIEYQTVLAILYVSYCTLQVPSNMILNKVSRPSLYVGTCVVLWGLVSALTGPHNTRWIRGKQRRLAQARLAEDAAEADEDGAGDSAFAGLTMALKDPKVPIFAVLACSQLLGLSFVNFFPTLTATLGYSTTVSLLLAAPPWIFAAIVCLLNAWHADKTGERFFHIAGWWWVVVVAYIIALSTMETAGRYVSMFLMACGYAGFALTLVWVSNAIPRPPAKRAAAIGIVNGFGNIGNLIGSFAWKAQWSPRYHQSMIIGIASLALASSMAF
ncbi:hypothetical protein FRC07_005238, partial [Ceratobasidium sp. 392]